MSNVKTVFVDVKLLVPKKLQKDLKGNEMLCPVCKGLGLVKRVQEYGVKGYRDPLGRVFPFQYENMQECHFCYHGVVRFCKHCGQPNRDKGKILAETSCMCEGAGRERDRERCQGEVEVWEKAEKITYTEALKRFEMLFISGYDRYVEVDNFEGWIEDRKADDEEFDVKDLRVYGTSVTKISFDASQMIENECEELHDEAENTIGADAKMVLQDLLDSWVAKYGGGTETYLVDYEVGVLVSE